MIEYIKSYNPIAYMVRLEIEIRNIHKVEPTIKINELDFDKVKVINTNKDSFPQIYGWECQFLKIVAHCKYNQHTLNSTIIDLIMKYDKFKSMIREDIDLIIPDYTVKLLDG